jgi:hypothetical protein
MIQRKDGVDPLSPDKDVCTFEKETFTSLIKNTSQKSVGKGKDLSIKIDGVTDGKLVMRLGKIHLDAGKYVGQIDQHIQLPLSQAKFRNSFIAFDLSVCESVELGRQLKL